MSSEVKKHKMNIQQSSKTGEPNEYKDGEVIEWGEWTTHDLFESKYRTSAIIKSRLSIKEYSHSITKEIQKWIDDDDDWDPFGGGGTYVSYDPPRYETTIHKYHAVNVNIIPQIGFKAGQTLKWTFVKPKIITNDDDENDKSTIRGDGIPSESKLISEILWNLYDLNYTQDEIEKNEIISLKDYTHNMGYTQIYLPLQLTDNLFLRYLNISNIPSIIGDIIRRYLGIKKTKISFFPDYIFDEQLVMYILPDMRVNEFKSLLITNLFVKYGDKGIQGAPKFICDVYRENGTFTKNRQGFDTDSDEHLLIFNDIEPDYYGLKLSNKSLENKCLILNIVGKGFKIIHFDDFKNIKFIDIIKEFHRFCGSKYDDRKEEIVAIYPNIKRMPSGIWREVFLPDTGDWRDRSVLGDSKAYPHEQLRKFITFNYEKYKSILNKSLDDLGININGCIIDMYLVTGPCIKLMFCSMVGDPHAMDINFDWSLDAFRMYAFTLNNRGRRGWRGYRSVSGGWNSRRNKDDETQTLYDVCKDFDTNDRSNCVEIR